MFYQNFQVFFIVVIIYVIGSTFSPACCATEGRALVSGGIEPLGSTRFYADSCHTLSILYLGFYLVLP